MFVVADALREAPSFLRELVNGGDIVSQGVGFGDANHDTEIRADKELGEFFRRKFIYAFPSLACVSVEGDLDFESDGEMWVCVDPLDGSLNYRLKGSTQGLPFAACVTVLERREGARFRDIIAAGVVDLRNGDQWLGWRHSDGTYRSLVNGVPARTLQIQAADIKNAVVLGEGYYPETRELMARAYSEESGYLRSLGAAGFEMALVSSGSAAAFVSASQKQHELGAGYALTLGAGGVVVDFDGSPLDDQPYTFNAKTPAILAANQAVADDLLRRVR